MSDVSIFDDDAWVPLEEFAASHPKWLGNAARLRDTARAPVGLATPAPPALAPHPVFDAWRDAILATATLRSPFELGPRFEPVDASTSFVGGDTAFLDSTEWPTCERCKRPLGVSLQLAERDVRPWLGRGGSLVVLYCFDCLPRSSSEGGISIAVVEGRCRVTRPSVERHGWQSSPARALAARGLAWHIPDSRLLVLRSHVYRKQSEYGGAADTLFGEETARDGDELIDLDEAFCDWLAQDEGSSLDQSYLGGYPRWDQDDATPDCPACKKPMPHLLDHNAGQFLDAALHLFVCDRAPACGGVFDWVAEF